MSTRTPICLLLAGGLLLSSTARAAQEDGPPSIEELIERYRERSEAALEARRAEVEYRLEQLKEHSKAEHQNSMDKVRAELIELGSEIAPLLIGSLDPGRKPDRAAQGFSTQIAMVLEELSLAPIHDPLIQIARSGSLAGRRLAIRVLGASTDSARVSPVLKELYAADESPPRATILTSLARLGGAENLSFVTDRLNSEDRAEIDAALYALTQARVSGAADHILVFAANTRTAAAHIEEICAWYRACPAVFDKQHGASTLQLMRSSRITQEDRIALVNLLSAHERHWPSNTKKTLEDMAETGNSELREAVLIALVLSGDRGAKRDLIRPYEEQLARNPRWNDAWIDLATVEYKIHEYRDAIKHYETAMKLGRIDTRSQRDVYLGLARCYALTNKYRDAQEWLQRAPISRKQLASLANDPDFVEMASHSRYGEVFGSEEG